MIRNSFIILDKFSYPREKQLWQQNIKDWNDFLSKKEIKGISTKRKRLHEKRILKSHEQLLENNSTYFSTILPKKDHWRLYKQFREESVFLDIETSTVQNGYITCITLYDGYNTMTFVKNHNLDFKYIQEILKKYKMIITFNGNVFDLPFLKKYYPNLIPNVPCWDLRHSCQKLGLKGGLKEVEKELNIKRQNIIIERLHGGDPIKLWRTYQATGDKYYLELLVEYNQEDTLNLQDIADKVYDRLISKIYNR